MIDARRMEVYTAFFDTLNVQKTDISADIIDENSYSDILKNRQVVFCGNGAAKCKDSIKHPNALFLDDIVCSAKYMAPLSDTAYREENFVDVAYFEPFYLKNFIATVPKKNIFK
jgi:tRNA threonylcarbamoyladenosine biosynthesis protein TsaB